jgi:hypothetical protein
MEDNTKDPYYVGMGQGHDNILRCKDCQALVTIETIQLRGMCDKCGNGKFGEIRLLNQEEMDNIRSGKIDFPARERFLAEFAGVE